jgi:hypothetical protein
MAEVLTSSRDGATKQAIIDFIRRTCGEDGSDGVPVEARVAVFDNDGTLWCEKPMPIQLDFIIRRLAEMVAAQLELRERQPWKAVGGSSPSNTTGSPSSDRGARRGSRPARRPLSPDRPVF